MTRLCAIKNGGLKRASGSITIFMAILLFIPAAALCSPKKLVDNSEYKRRQSPPGIKITPKAFGRDRRMPITNKYKG